MIATRNMLRSGSPGMIQPPCTSAAIRSRGALNSDLSATGFPSAPGSTRSSCERRAIGA